MSNSNIRLKIIIRGIVQGVGFRPAVYRSAFGMGLTGWVRNTAHGLIIEVEGARQRCELFLKDLREDPPEHARIVSLETSHLDPKGYQRFEILESEGGDPKTFILPDIATCDACREEVLDPSNRRHRYPFTNCTQCGPRYSIIQSLPYDRNHTTMKNFTMCPDCQREYDDPGNRRFHAQPNACPVCGPQIEFWDNNGKVLSSRDAAFADAKRAILEGKIVALKGLGGFQLIVDATNPDAVARLREQKHREAKPFAVMFPNIETAKQECVISEREEILLQSPEAPIVLVKKQDMPSIAENVAPNNPNLGVMLPYTPLHLMLLSDLHIPLVATSGNISEEPMCIDEQDALARLKNIADYFLVHNRPIARAVDDSVARVVLDREMILRRARGYAPLPFILKNTTDRNFLAVGGHLKNTIAVSKGNNVFISQHIGDLETALSYEAFRSTIDDLCRMYDITVTDIVCDEHPNYLSSQYAAEKGIPIHKVQHHFAHTFSCMADNDLDGDVLGVSWDGTGFGLDETIWGGEFVLIDHGKAKRIASFRRFSLPGGEQAIKEPRRAALGFLFSIMGHEVFEKDGIGLRQQFSDEEWKNLETMLMKDINCPRTSSVGRLFDVLSALLDVRQVLQFEGQAAMEVEFLAEQAKTDEYFDFEIKEQKGLPEGAFFEITFPLVKDVWKDLNNNVAKELICAKFHNTLVEIGVQMAKAAQKKKVAISGGCFQNRYLLERAVQRLREEGFQPYWHQRVPPNDGGICLGQIISALGS